MGYQDATGFEASCWDGSESEFAIHAFADGPGTEAIGTICKRIVAAMEVFEPASISLTDYEWVRTVVLPDEMAERLHGVVSFRMIAVELA